MRMELSKATVLRCTSSNLQSGLTRIGRGTVFALCETNSAHGVPSYGTPLASNTSPTVVAPVQGIAAPWTESSSELLSRRSNVMKAGTMSLDFDVPPRPKPSRVVTAPLRS
jgi:hypothetical protein